MNPYKKNAFLLLGANLGEPIEKITQAREILSGVVGQAVKSSSLYRTEPWGNPDQPWFINQVVWVATPLAAPIVHEKIMQIETELGRTDTGRWHPRVIDIDLLFYESEIIDSPKLRVPHPQISGRRFTLVPLVEVAPDFIHPVHNQPLRALLEACTDPLRVERVRS